MSEYRGIAPEVTAWERTVAIYRCARKAGARLRARDLITPNPERWFREYAGPLLGRIQTVMHERLEERIRLREIAMGIEAQEILDEVSMTSPPGEGSRLDN